MNYPNELAMNELAMNELVANIGKDTVCTQWNGNYVINIHASGNKKIFIKQLSYYCKFVDSVNEKVFLCGDFNAGCMLESDNRTFVCTDKNGKEMFRHVFAREATISKPIVATTNKIRVISTQFDKVNKVNCGAIDFILLNNCIMTVETVVESGSDQNVLQPMSACSDHFAVSCKFNDPSITNSVVKVKSWNICGESAGELLSDQATGLQKIIQRNIFEFVPRELYESYLQKKDRIQQIINEYDFKETNHSKTLRPTSELQFLELFNTHMLPPKLHEKIVQNDFFKSQLDTYNRLYNEFIAKGNESQIKAGLEVLTLWEIIYTDEQLEDFFVEWFNLAATTVKMSFTEELFGSINEYDIVGLQEVTDDQVQLLNSINLMTHDIIFGPKFKKYGEDVEYKTRGALIVRKHA